MNKMLAAIWLRACDWEGIDPRGDIFRFSTNNPWTEAYFRLLEVING